MNDRRRPMNILVTGASGFIGRVLCPLLAARGHSVVAACREASRAPATARVVVVGGIGPETDWSTALDGVDTIIHLASRAHVLRDEAADPLAEFRRVNTQGTVQLARAARIAGVRRLVYVSSIGVHGSSGEVPLTEDSPIAPAEPYAVSKWEAEQGLRDALNGASTEWVVVRPPLVYGPGCPGNFRRLLALTARGLPLPLGSFDNRRSLVGVDNLADALALCAEHGEAAGRTFLVADDPPISTPALMATLAEGMGRPSRLWRLPTTWVMAAAGLVGRRAPLAKLCGTLQVDSARIRSLLGWTQPIPLRDGLLAAGRWYARRDR